MERKLKAFPHEGVYTQLLASRANSGKAGVFAVVPIMKGINPFPFEAGDVLYYVSEKELKAQRLPGRTRQIYRRLGALAGDRRYTYRNFAALPQSAYVADDQEDPNLRYGDNDQLYTLRKIKAGEELTVDYSTIG